MSTSKILYGKPVSAGQSESFRIPHYKNIGTASKFILVIDLKDKIKTLYAENHREFSIAIDNLPPWVTRSVLLVNNVIILSKCVPVPLMDLFQGVDPMIIGDTIFDGGCESFIHAMEYGISVLHEKMQHATQSESNLVVNVDKDRAKDIAETFINKIVEENDAFFNFDS